MAFPGWLTALTATLGGMQQQQQQQQQQKQRQQMIEALLQRRAQQNPGGIGAMGPQNWGANNSSQGGVISDQWGNPIGPAGAPLITPSPQPGVPQGNPLPGIAPDQGAGAVPPMPTNTYSPMAAAQPVPFMGGPSQATPPPGAGGFQAPIDPMDEAVVNALFAPQGA